MAARGFSKDGSTQARGARLRRSLRFVVGTGAALLILGAVAGRARACTIDADCDDNLACTGTETCVLGSCVAGTPVDCSAAADQCMECSEPSGTCSTPKEDGFGCDDGNRCTFNDTCVAGACQPGSGGDGDGDGYCDNEETDLGCSPSDGAEIPPQANIYTGGSSFSRGEVLATFNAPGARTILTTDPSCATSGVCDNDTGFCSAGRVADPCTADADCNAAPGVCRVVINYADASDLVLVFATLKPRGAPAIDVAPLFMPITPGCSRKVEIQLPNSGFVKAKLRLKVKGTTNGRMRRDTDRVYYREP